MVAQPASGRRRSQGGRIGRPPGRTRDETIERLVSAAQEHFGSRGFAGARLVEIAADAGVTHSSIYQYFLSKEDLYRSAFDAAQRSLLPRYLASVENETTLRGQLGAIFHASAAVHNEDPNITPFLASVPVEVRRHPELLGALQELGGPLVAALHELFEAARQRGEIPPDTPDNGLLLAFIGSAMGIGLLSHGLGMDSMDQAVDIVLRAFDGELFSDGDA